MHYIPKKLYIKANAQTNAIVLDFEKSEHATYASHKWLVHKNYLGMHCIFFFKVKMHFTTRELYLLFNSVTCRDATLAVKIAMIIPKFNMLAYVIKQDGRQKWI